MPTTSREVTLTDLFRHADVAATQGPDLVILDLFIRHSSVTLFANGTTLDEAVENAWNIY